VVFFKGPRKEDSYLNGRCGYHNDEQLCDLHPAYITPTTAAELELLISENDDYFHWAVQSPRGKFTALRQYIALRLLGDQLLSLCLL
jgi:hypothetical protein